MLDIGNKERAEIKIELYLQSIHIFTCGAYIKGTS